MKRNTEYHIGVRNVGDGASDIKIFSGTPETLFPKFIQYLVDVSMRTRIDMVLVRHEHEVIPAFAKRDTKQGGQTASEAATRLTTGFLAGLDFSNAKE